MRVIRTQSSLLDLIDFALVALLWSVDSFAWHDPCFKE
jgi:hypothetical protein